ncbi:MAG: hypothetical protein HKL80_08925 [Acidimicrobiales bacterium]|nr:hypothetical protein [Acidimicrobiales bacterium]
MKKRSLKSLTEEYLALASVALAQRLDVVLETLDIRNDQLEEIRESEAFGASLAAIREAETRGFNPEIDFRNLVRARTLGTQKIWLLYYMDG